MSSTWWEYLQRITDAAPGSSIATVAGVNQANISRWRTGSTRPSAEAVVRISRAYNRPPVEALIAAGYIDSTEVDQVVTLPRSIEDFSDDELLQEIGRRLGRG